mgnify:CR=1 FL=1
MWNSIREWSSEFTSPFAEALKEAFRVTLFSVPGQLLVLLERKDVLIETIAMNLLLIFIRALDKYLYEKSKLTKAKVDVAGGLSPI